MERDATKLRYALYARKSSEQDDKQAASIEAQKHELQELAGRQGLNISLVLEESCSAKEPGRPVFLELVEKIKAREVNALLAWHPNRLSRNIADLHVLTQLMQEGLLLYITTPSQTYRGDNPMDLFLFLFSIGQAKLENDNKGIDVKRGLRAKARAGIYPAPAPLGYTNDKYAERGNKTILPDKTRFHLVRQLFDLMLTGRYTPPQLIEIANNEIKLVSKKGRKICRSELYHIFHNPFYYGSFEYPIGSGDWHKGIHKPMITKTEFDRIQMLITKNKHPRSKKPAGLLRYRGFIRCGECGAMITAEEKSKQTKAGINKYIYYHCTKRVNPNCSQKCIREEDLELLLIKALGEIQISEQLHRWAMKELKRMNADEISNRASMIGAWQRQYNASVQKLKNLIDMRANGELTEEEFKEEKTSLATEKEHFRVLLANEDNGVNNWIQAAENCLDFAEKARTTFENGSSDTKTNILASLGSNLLLKDKILSIHWAMPFDRIKEMAQEETMILSRLEPENIQLTQGQMAELYDTSSTMLRD